MNPRTSAQDHHVPFLRERPRDLRPTSLAAPRRAPRAAPLLPFGDLCGLHRSGLLLTCGTCRLSSFAASSAAASSPELGGLLDLNVGTSRIRSVGGDCEVRGNRGAHLDGEVWTRAEGTNRFCSSFLGFAPWSSGTSRLRLRPRGFPGGGLSCGPPLDFLFFFTTTPGVEIGEILLNSSRSRRRSSSPFLAADPDAAATAAAVRRLAATGAGACRWPVSSSSVAASVATSSTTSGPGGPSTE
mmetsp:Transcript_5070/g.14056  ORF Transcript_5070/g.14056 Transcript_5070/m.14056 type:complete len:242 (+) Transcript_5070:254-979(+)